jgi:hypothetical protein
MQTTEFISLGGNCSVAYQLHKRGLRDVGFPFDWSKSTMNQLLSSLEDKLEKYVSSLEISEFSNNHPYIKISGPLPKQYDNMLQNQGTYKCCNEYGITMSHELVIKDDLATIKEKLSRRVHRFLNLGISEREVLHFIRVEMKIVAPDNYITKLVRLINSILNITDNTKVVKFSLIFHSSNSGMYEYIQKNCFLQALINNGSLDIKCHYYSHFSADWTMPQVDWDDVFNS